jgi:hypothetical protein
MQTISELKEQAVTETPLLLFDCTFSDGRTEHWSTNRVTVDAIDYEPRVLRHNVFEIQTASDQGVDGIPRISLVLADADSHFSQLEHSAGMKGAKLIAKFMFFDLREGTAATEATVVFRGLCNPPEEITETEFRVSATNRMSMQRVLLPQVRIQRRCPWDFPANAEQRQEAVDGGNRGKYSRFYRCGYSADMDGGKGSMNDGTPFVSCGRTREDCTERGMFANFGGIEFVPSTIEVRSFGEKGSHLSAVRANEARYNDFVPMLYGTAWYNPPVVFARNDGNLTRMEVLLGIGEIQGVLKVLVNDVEIPLGRAGTNMTGTGWYNVPTLGTRTGGFNLDFEGSDGTPAGDPYGSMAYLSVVVPNRLNDGRSLPTVKVLVQGLKVPVYNSDGTPAGESFTNNPAWVLLDILRRSGWTAEEIDLGSFAIAAAYCEEPINAKDLYGNAIAIPRFQCNLVIQKRRSAGELIRGVRNGSRLYLTYGAEGAVQLRVENTLQLQQPVKIEGSNAREEVAGGWPAYEFGDGTYGLSGILRRANGEASVRLWGRSTTDAGNRLAVEFQDSLNAYQQDSFSLVDAEDVAKVGQEVTAPLGALGIPNYDQAGRILKFNLDKSLKGNLYAEFETSVRGVGLRPGDVITLTYLKAGLDRQPFRVLKIAPGANYATSRITVQIHDDHWYLDTNGQSTAATGSGREEGAGIGVPRPIGGTVHDQNGDTQFGIEETTVTGGDGSLKVNLAVSFTAPPTPTAGGPGAPLLNLAPDVQGTGSLNGPQTLYYAVSGVDQDGAEGVLSFAVRADIPAGEGKSVRLSALSFGRGTVKFRVYRGATPAQLSRIASDQELAAEFTDSGSTAELTPPPDANFDHANFYWRFELQPEAAATIHSSNTIGNQSLEMPADRYHGAVARVLHGRASGQERLVISNSATTLTVAPPWDIEPDADSSFVIAEGGWKFGAVSRTSPVAFEAPNRPGEIIQISGRSANVNDAECAPEVSIVTRWTIGGDGSTDCDAPPAPVFGIGPGRRGGTVEVSGIAFPSLENTHTITAGTLTLFYWNELQGPPAHVLALEASADDTVLTLNQAGTAEAGTFVQAGAEILRVEEVLGDCTSYRVSRGAHDTAAEPHEAGSVVYHLESSTTVLPFPKNFFGSPYSGSWSNSLLLPDIRLASAELFVTNVWGDSGAASMNLTGSADYGLRTLSGGQYTMQVEGFLAVDSSATPVLVVDATHAVRDVFAVLGQAADAPVEVQVNVDDVTYCTMTVLAGQTTSNGVDGFTLPLLNAGARVTLSVLSTGTMYPGSDLTVIIRL